MFRIDCGGAIRFNAAGVIFWAIDLRAKPMKKKLKLTTVLAASQILSLSVLSLFSCPALAQTKLTPKAVTARADNCAPIGRTANGEMVYSMKCETLPAPVRPSPPPQAELKEAAPPAPEVQRSGLFGMSYEVKRPDQ
jgi:hypothetical protein